MEKAKLQKMKGEITLKNSKRIISILTVLAMIAVMFSAVTLTTAAESITYGGRVGPESYAWLENADLNGSLYRLLQDYGIAPGTAVYDFSQRGASAEEAALLGTEAGTLLLGLHIVVYDQKGRPLHSSSQLIRGDRYTVRI